MAHLDGAANGEPAVEAAAEPEVEAKKDEAAPTEVNLLCRLYCSYGGSRSLNEKACGRLCSSVS